MLILQQHIRKTGTGTVTSYIYGLFSQVFIQCFHGQLGLDDLEDTFMKEWNEPHKVSASKGFRLQQTPSKTLNISK